MLAGHNLAAKSFPAGISHDLTRRLTAELARPRVFETSHALGGHCELTSFARADSVIQNESRAIFATRISPQTFHDDDSGVQFSSWKFLKADGFTVLTADDGKAALEASRKYPAQLIC